MSRLDATLAHLAPGVGNCRDLGGRYNPRRGLAIYCLPIPGYTPSSPGMVLGEALAARSGLGCTMLEGIPEKIPEGAAVIAQYNALKAVRPDLLEDVPELHEQGQYAIKLGRSALITSSSREGLASGMQTLAMLVLRHGEDHLPGCVITDTPVCQARCLAVELDSREIGIVLLRQIVSFAATFKANRLHLILNEDFDPGREIEGIETFVEAYQSFGITLGVRMPVLGKILSKRKTLIEAWTDVRAAARAFGATQAVIDDPCPDSVKKQTALKIVESVVNGDVGVQNVSLDANLLVKADYPPAWLRGTALTGWYRIWDRSDAPSEALAAYPLTVDVQGPIPGFSARTMGGYYHRLDGATRWLRQQARRELTISFRHLGASHLWQNLMYPAATGLISAWGLPERADEAAWRFSNLLYGDLARQVMGMWDMLAKVFPAGNSEEGERFIRRTMFGRWPGSSEEWEALRGIDWTEVTQGVRSVAESLKDIVPGLSRNAVTLSGARLSLYALSWLHCFAALAPELERRREGDFEEDGRTRAIVTELYGNFQGWHAHLHELQEESGLEFSELSSIDVMGERLRTLYEEMLG